MNVDMKTDGLEMLHYRILGPCEVIRQEQYAVNSLPSQELRVFKPSACAWSLRLVLKSLQTWFSDGGCGRAAGVSHSKACGFNIYVQALQQDPDG